MENTKLKPTNNSVDTRQEIALNLSGINKNLMLAAFTGVEFYHSNYSDILNEYRKNLVVLIYFDTKSDQVDIIYILS